MSCKHDCPQPPLFPAPIRNRPGLKRIGYRIGDYARFREAMLARLDQAWELRGWTHRGADDPGIALLEGAAEVAEVLAFYQELYANEAFLRTATWDTSLRDLVALTGYRPAPGVGGKAVFALEVDGKKAVAVPAGFGFKAQLAGAEDTAEFESTKAVAAYPSLSRFRIYRPRKAPANLTKGLTRLELTAVGGKRDLTTRAALELDQGDRLMLVPDAAIWDKGGGSYDATKAQAAAEILVVKEVERILDRIVIRLEGTLTVDRGTKVAAYKIGRSFRHFGHNAPNSIGGITKAGVYKSTPTLFKRPLSKDYSSTDLKLYSDLSRTVMPLDTQVDDLAVGAPLICQGSVTLSEKWGAWSWPSAFFPGLPISPYSSSVTASFTLVRRIRAVDPDTLTWGGVGGSSTLVSLESELVTNTDIKSENADIRRLRFHETLSPPLTLHAPSAWGKGSFTAAALTFFGTHAEAKALAGRDLLLQHDDGRVRQVAVASKAADFDVSTRDATDRWLWSVSLAAAPDFEQEAFDESKPKVWVFGNLVPADQGKTLAEAVLGSGDRRRSFQTFKLPKGPLTHFLDSSRTPPQRPELKIYVDGVLWRQVDSFFGQSAEAHVYVVRHDEKGNSYIQFGDGKSGARLPSGQGNLVARYRIGIGAKGALEQDATPSATGKLKPLTKVHLPGKVVGGGAAETAERARENAPLRTQSLGRLVGLADFEAEAAALPGVLKAQASYAAPTGSPQVRILVLAEGGTDADAAQIQNTLRAYNRRRGAARWPVVVKGGKRRYVRMALTLGCGPSRRQQDIAAAVRAALGVMDSAGKDNGSGLLAMKRRRFGQDLHRSQAIAAVQQVTGVRWVRIDALQSIPEGEPPASDPADLTLPAVQSVSTVVPCPGERLLALYTGHLSLALVADQDARECAS